MKLYRKFPVSRSRCAQATPWWRGFSNAALVAAGVCFALPVFAAQIAKPSPAIAKNQAPAQQAPVSLASQAPKAATVTLSGGKLTVRADNSDLLQILQAVSAQSGMKIEGSPGNHRVFGTYGPGEPRAVLAHLLTGFGYNYLLVGSGHDGVPAKLVLTHVGSGASSSEPAPSPPVHSVQPAPRNTLPQPQSGRRPPYQPSGRAAAAGSGAASGSGAHAQKAHAPRKVPSPQEILKELEKLHGKQKNSHPQATQQNPHHR